MSGWKLELNLVDPDGRVYSRIDREVDPYLEVPYTPPPGPYGASSFNAVIQVMKDRDKRTTFLIEATRNMGKAMAEHLQDKEGWHGESRYNTIERMEGDPRR